VFFVNQAVHAIMICSFVLGVYSQHFANGGIQCFFIGFINVYVFALCVINYPVLVPKQFEMVLNYSTNTQSVEQIEMRNF
jgi:hypothetical protein